jgi:PII-like signaling protein
MSLILGLTNAAVGYRLKDRRQTMLETGPALKVTVHMNQDTGSTHGFLTDDILVFLQDKGIAGATVLRPYAGFGAHHRLHSIDAGDVAGLHLPVVVYFVDEVGKVRSILPELLAMVTDGFVEAHPTEVLKVIHRPEKVLS